MKNKKKVVKYKKPFYLNIGMVLFFVIIIYLVVYIIRYVQTNTTAFYEVIQGNIASNNTYRALILRDEEVVKAGQAGYINYYQKNGARVSVNDYVYSIDKNGDISNQIKKTASGTDGLSDRALKEFSESVENFTTQYNRSDFSLVSTYKADLNSQLQQIVATDALSSLSQQVSIATANNSFYMPVTGQTGVVAFYVDGYEKYNLDNFSGKLMNYSNYEKKNLNANESVKASAPAYKLITKEAWSIVMSVSDDVIADIEDGDYLKVRFCVDDYTASGKCKIIKENGNNYLALTFQSAMIRYINERFADVELVVNEKNGLKIPKSAITTKEFFTIPKDCFTKGGDSDKWGLLVKKVSEQGENVQLINPEIFYETDDYFYVDDEDVSEGDVIIINDSSQLYTIGQEKAELMGVYNINKGYAVFKQINILYENDEYAIIEPKTAYGVSLYDHIALDGSSLVENQMTAN